MGARHHVRRLATLFGFAALLAGGPFVSSLSAQEPPRKTEAKSVRERALEKLRALDRAGRPALDSVAVDSAANEEGAAGATGKPTGPGVERAGAGARDSVQATDPTQPVAPRVDPGAVPLDPSTPTGAPVDPAGEDPSGPPSPTTLTESRASGRGPALLPGAPVIVHMSPDSFAAALRGLEGYTLTEYTAQGGATFVADSGRLELVGTPSLRREGQSMRSDSLLVYNEPTSIICGYGKPVLEGTEGEPVESDQVCYNVDRRLGVALGARTTFSQDGTWFVHGNELYTAGENRIYGAHTEFTSCDLDVPHYHFAAESVKIVHDEILVARNVTLRFQDVPVFWLPFMVQSMKQGRRSGLLTPDFALSDVVRTSSGMQRQITNLGYYWAINDYMDAQMAFGWRSNDWKALNGRFQYNWAQQFLRGGVDFTHYWGADGNTNLTLSTSNSWQPGENTSVQLSGNFASSSHFVEERSFDPEQLTRSISSSASLSHSFDWGRLNIGASRNQYLTENRTVWKLPSMSLNVTPITLFPSTGEARWFNNATWNGSVSFDAQRTDADEARPGAANRDSQTRSGNVQSSFRMGNFSWSQSANFQENSRDLKPWVGDTTVVDSALVPAYPAEFDRTVNWNTALSYTQRLIGTSTFSPSVSFGGRIVESAATGGEQVAGPTRVNFSASLNTNLYGFWPGFGPFSRLRHSIDPSLSYSYSPVPEVTDRQREIFGEQAGHETNQLRLTLRQTFEAKYKDEDGDSTAEAVDTTAASLTGEPRRLPQSRKIKLLSLQTSAMVYDFARAKRDEYGFTTTQLSHTVSSDLLEGLSFRLSHDIFRMDTDEDGHEHRTFEPRLRSLETSFSLDSDSWIFRVLGLGRRSSDRAEDVTAADSVETDAEDDLDLPGSGSFMGPEQSYSRGPRGAVGTWRADLTYSLRRPPAGSDAEGDQMVRGTVSFQPTEHWSVNWRTSYSFTDGEFSDHILSFSRDIHRWQANFDFVKSINGNLMFRFNVHLLDNQHIKFRHDERYDSIEPLAPPPAPR